MPRKRGGNLVLNAAKDLGHVVIGASPLIIAGLAAYGIAKAAGAGSGKAKKGRGSKAKRKSARAPKA